MAPIVYLNGAFIPREEACISPDDRGFYFADGVYEVVKYYQGKPFCFPEHINRLNNSLDGVRIHYKNTNNLITVCERLMDITKMKNESAGVYIQITRGVAPRTHSFPGNDVIPTVYVTAFVMPSFINELENGVKVIT